MLIIPFMSCSARLPVYVLLISHSSRTIRTCSFTIYIIGIMLAVLVALVFKRIFFAKQDIPFVMELPPYRIPLCATQQFICGTRASSILQKWER